MLPASALNKTSGFLIESGAGHFILTLDSSHSLNSCGPNSQVTRILPQMYMVSEVLEYTWSEGHLRETPSTQLWGIIAHNEVECFGGDIFAVTPT